VPAVRRGVPRGPAGAAGRRGTQTHAEEPLDHTAEPVPGGVVQVAAVEQRQRVHRLVVAAVVCGGRGSVEQVGWNTPVEPETRRLVAICGSDFDDAKPFMALRV